LDESVVPFLSEYLALEEWDSVFHPLSLEDPLDPLAEIFALVKWLVTRLAASSFAYSAMMVVVVLPWHWVFSFPCS
jgi:hypothetical protein